MEKEEIIDKLERQIEKKKKLPKDVENKINKKIFERLLISIGISFFYILLIFGFHNIEREVYLKDIKVFSIALCIISILLFEYSYKKESMKICVVGIENLILALVTLFCTYICILQEAKYIAYLALVSYVFTIYNLIKSVRIYKKMKNDYIKTLSDINDIVKKENPIRKSQTSRKRR